MSSLLGIFSRPGISGTPEPTGALSAPTAPATQSPTTSQTAMPDELPVLDCLGSLLQTWARHPIALPDEERSSAERTIAGWHRHALLGTPIPGVHAPDKSAGPLHERDWKAIASLASERRRAEARNAGQQLGDLQRVVWETVTSLVRVAGDDAVTDAAVQQQLTLLRDSAERGDTAAVMRDLPGALQAITDAISARQSRAARERLNMAERVESLGRALSDAEDSARTDALTGAGNRLRFSEAAERALALMTLSGSPAALITVDLDGLKRINDTLGHPAGDAAIKAVAKSCWIICTRATDVVCRLGGDEFAIVMTNTNATAAASLADRLEHRLTSTRVQLTDEVSDAVTAAIGFAAAKPGDTAESWLTRADRRLYEAKRRRATQGEPTTAGSEK